jgi:ATP-dependent DNA helicase RecQ
VPPYIVFGDTTLVQMARDKPSDTAALLAITGVGQHKLQKYGREFLDVITRHGETQEATPEAVAD